MGSRPLITIDISVITTMRFPALDKRQDRPLGGHHHGRNSVGMIPIGLTTENILALDETIIAMDFWSPKHPGKGTGHHHAR